MLAKSGEFYERDARGHVVELGRVLEWVEPERLVLDWYPGTDAAHPTRVVVRFLPEGNQTRVVGSTARPQRAKHCFPGRTPRYQASWDLVLAALARALRSD